MYINKEDLKTVLYSYQVEDITDGDDTIVEQAIEAAQEEVKSYLINTYDIEAEFAESNKNKLLVEITKDLALWQLVRLANVDVIYDKAKSRYDRAIEWLKKVNKGEITPSLQKYENPEGDEGKRIRFGSNEKFNHQY